LRTATGPAEVTADAMRAYARHSGRRYWRKGADALGALPVARSPVTEAGGDAVAVALPQWAADLGVGSPPGLLVHASTLVAGDAPAHARCDWWMAAFHHLNGTTERGWEARHGSAHSYAFRIDARAELFDRAWVNRIYLFLRRTAARRHGSDESSLFGALPEAQIVLTHDLDVVGRPLGWRARQGVFHLFNAARFLGRGDPRAAAARIGTGLRLALGRGDLCDIDALLERTRRQGRKAMLFVYAGDTGVARGLPGMLVDPSYRLDDTRLTRILRTLANERWRIGLHPSFSSWQEAAPIARERERLEHAIGAAVRSCRQHWLRFSWSRTWRAQAAAGIRLDMTLGFNDRPGFRNGAALAFSPWDPLTGRPHDIVALPTVMMDSQFFDYEVGDVRPVGDRIAHWVDEVRTVRGSAAVLWHPHTLHPDIGWAQAFDTLLEQIGPGDIPPEFGAPEYAL
jgi:hypothetical protein